MKAKKEAEEREKLEKREAERKKRLVLHSDPPPSQKASQKLEETSQKPVRNHHEPGRN